MMGDAVAPTSSEAESEGAAAHALMVNASSRVMSNDGRGKLLSVAARPSRCGVFRKTTPQVVDKGHAPRQSGATPTAFRS